MGQRPISERHPAALREREVLGELHAAWEVARDLAESGIRLTEQGLVEKAQRASQKLQAAGLSDHLGNNVRYAEYNPEKYAAYETLSASSSSQNAEPERLTESESVWGPDPQSVWQGLDTVGSVTTLDRHQDSGSIAESLHRDYGVSIDVHGFDDDMPLV